MLRRSTAGRALQRGYLVSRCLHSSTIKYNPNEQPHTASSSTQHSTKRKGKNAIDVLPIAPSVEAGQSHRTQYNIDPFSLLPTEDHYTYPLVTPAKLAKSVTRPRKVRMLASDFIHDSLYNPHYGYFSRHAVLLPDGIKQDRSYDFKKFNSERDFMAAVEERYIEFEDSLKDSNDYQRLGRSSKGSDKKAYAFTKEGMEAAQSRGRLDAERQAQSEREAGEHDRDVKVMAARQVWHTPTELFKPYYAQAIARYIMKRHAEQHQGKPLNIFEVGAGSGALALDILCYLSEHHSEVYKTAVYTIIEISPRLAKQQESLLKSHIKAGRAKIVNKSIFNYDQIEAEGSFFIALEVLDNLTHDVVRYSIDTLQPFQAIVSIDGTGDMHELWEPAQDERILRYLQIIKEKQHRDPPTGPAYLSWLSHSIRSAMSNHLPFYPNLTQPHFVPTGSLQLLDILAARFPNHHAIISDFNKLPDALVGLNAPVVQTRLEGSMIPVSTYTVQQGFFDIFFPTNFEHLQHTHSAIMKGAKNPATVMDHRSFLQQYAQTDNTTCKDGSNPMLSWYANASWFLS